MITQGALLPQRIREVAHRDPARLAMKSIDGDEASWLDVHTSILLWADALRNAGVRRGDTVATLLPNTFTAFYAWLGVAWLCAIEVPINTGYRGTILKYVIDNSQAKILIASKHFLNQIADVQKELVHLETIVVADATESDTLPDLEATLVRGQDLLNAAQPNDLDGPKPRDVAAMVYTSGTTGPSKGVLVPWGEMYHGLEFIPTDMVSPGTPYYSVFPTFHISGKVSLYIAAHYDACLLIRETFSRSEFWNDVRQFGVDAVGLAGPMAAMLMAAPPSDDDADNPLRSLALGPVIPNIREFCDRFAIERFATAYGTTEVGFPIVSPWNPPDPKTCGHIRTGAPHYELRIVDQDDIPVAPGVVGELIVRTADPWTMNIGYWGMPDVTASAWRNGWFHTGDAFVQDEDGWLYLADRIKDTLRRRGENISSLEAEQAILEHPAVAECAVLAVPSELGEDDVKAVIALKPDQPLTPEQLIEYLLPRMSGFMIPRYVEFVNALPRTDATFRVRKAELRLSLLNDATWDRTRATQASVAGRR